MEIALFKTLWGHEGGFSAAIDQCHEAGFHGIEGPVPDDSVDRAGFFGLLESSGLEWIAEIGTCTPTGSYVPLPGYGVGDHLKSLEEAVCACLEGGPRFINTMAGHDAWSADDSLHFCEGVLGLQEKHDIVISVETHRGRPTYSPWLTRDLLLQMPELRITCDFSHWCVVSERLLLDEDVELLSLAAKHAHHIHARVGYSQGPQVPDPRAPEYADALAAHERWWAVVWDSMATRGITRFSMTPEFGPDGYLQSSPFTCIPVADLWELNRWMGSRQRDRFERHFNQRAL